MDENLLKVARERPFYIRKDKNPEFYSAIQRDTNFLTKHSMMDYSLLVGIDADTDDLVLVGLLSKALQFIFNPALNIFYSCH
jgi:1-phosphatidylinositol-3-phosphate 5-kinase